MVHITHQLTIFRKNVTFPTYVSLTTNSGVNDDGTLDNSKTHEDVIVDIIEEVPSSSLSQGELYFLYIRFEEGYGLRSNSSEEEYVEVLPGVYCSSVSYFQ